MRGIHCTVFATGCIYEYDEKHKVGGNGYKEEEEANFGASFYSATKSRVEEVSTSALGSVNCCTDVRFWDADHENVS